MRHHKKRCFWINSLPPTPQSHPLIFHSFPDSPRANGWDFNSYGRLTHHKIEHGMALFQAKQETRVPVLVMLYVGEPFGCTRNMRREAREGQSGVQRGRRRRGMEQGTTHRFYFKCQAHVITGLPHVNRPKTVPSESFHTPWLIPHYVVLQTEIKMD